LVLIPGSEFLGKDRLQVMLPYTKNVTQQGNFAQRECLIGSMSGNLTIYNGASFTPFRTDADSILKSSLLYKGIVLNGNYALVTTGKGLIIINSEGKIKQVINRSSGLQSETLYSLFLDNKGALW